MQRILNILFWSVISAAFIGPGTVTTAASSGARFGFGLLWALLFSTIACLVLQEASARLTVVSGRTLAQAIREHFRGGVAGAVVLLVVLGAIVLGCAAYQAGNILGSVAGAALAFDVRPRVLTLLIGMLATVLLFFGTIRGVARMLGIAVAVMGVAFLATAVCMRPPLAPLLAGLLKPSFPGGAGLLILGLVGTTVVPYNLFLGSSIARGQKLDELRFGLGVAVVFGGIISMGILVVGTAVEETFSFTALSDALTGRLGEWSAGLFALGLGAAGLSSAITAPMAAAVTAAGLLGRDGDTRWSEKGIHYRAVWFAVLLTGVVFGLLDVKPIPAIILAQALNGVLLPFVAVFLFVIVNSRRLMGAHGRNGLWANAIMGGVVAITMLLGVSKTLNAVAAALTIDGVSQDAGLMVSLAITLVLAVPILRAVRRARTQ